eukprot:836648-Alexandrium_andersonii.AAC.1
MAIHGFLLWPQWHTQVDRPGLEPLVELFDPSQGSELLPEASLMLGLSLGVFACMRRDSVGLSSDLHDPAAHLTTFLS